MMYTRDMSLEGKIVGIATKKESGNVRGITQN